MEKKQQPKPEQGKGNRSTDNTPKPKANEILQSKPNY